MTPPRAPEAAVVASTPITWAVSGPNDGLISLGLGLLGVLLARIIFVNRENRALGRVQSWWETLPITGAALLIAGGIIWDQHLLYSKAIFTGLGVGWGALVALNAISKAIVPGGPANRDPEAGAGEPDPAPHLSETAIRRSLRESYQPPLVPHPEHDEHLRALDEGGQE